MLYKTCPKVLRVKLRICYLYFMRIIYFTDWQNKNVLNRPQPEKCA